MFEKFDVIVVGAGHAGCEAAAASANRGAKTLLVTMNMQTIAQMSCNPAMGGIAKGQILREIDALGGYSGIISDLSSIQFRMLNKSKGPAMWSPRTQNDRMQFAHIWREKLEQISNLYFWQEMVQGLFCENGTVKGVRTAMGVEIYSKSVILTNGTFLNGIIHIGEKQFGGGRAGERSATGITEQLVSFGFESGRMKTGTPPRIDGRSLNYDRMEAQPGDDQPEKFSFDDSVEPVKNQIPCYITYTNTAVHNLLKQGFGQSPMFAGRIKGLGPRYCPSIEDKIERFSERDRHQLFVEPEGRNTVEVYLNGFSTSLPEDVQYKALKQVAGFEDMRMFRPGYAIEYDYFPPVQLKNSLETKIIHGLFFAGQINGTTGYEEAACQGLMAGINAVQYIRNEEPIVLDRSIAYIGVLIDDLINKGTDEPYRMFTSRAEYRILLRQDNADLRLTPIGRDLGLISDVRFNRLASKLNAVEQISKFLASESIKPELVNPLLSRSQTTTISQKVKLKSLLSRPQLNLWDIAEYVPSVKGFLMDFDPEFINQAEIQLKYERYIEKEQETVSRMSKFEETQLHQNFNYEQLSGLSSEAKEKLKKLRPATVGQASRISGVSPADISVLMVYLSR